MRKVKERTVRTMLLCMSIFIFVFMISTVSAFNLGKFDYGENVTLRQVCDCDSVNISSVYNPYGEKVLNDTLMTKSGNEFTLEFTDTDSVGYYLVSGYDDEDNVFSYTFEIERDDAFGINLYTVPGIVLFCIILGLAVGLFFLGLHTFSSVLFMANGIMLLFNGFNYLYSVIFFILGFLLLFGGKK